MSLLKICTPQRSLWSRNRPTGSPQMRSLGSPQRLLGSLAAPQFEGIKNLFSCTEKVPYTTLKQFDVSSVFYFFYLMMTATYNDCWLVQGYDMRLYPSVKWACTELTYEREEDEEVAVEVEEDEAVASLKALQSWNSNKKDRKNRPQSQMFMKLFRWTFIGFQQTGNSYQSLSGTFLA